MSIVHAALSALSHCTVEAANALHPANTTIQQLHKKSMRHPRKAPNSSLPNIGKIIRVLVNYNNCKIFFDIGIDSRVSLLKMHISEQIGVRPNLIALCTEEEGFFSDDSQLLSHYKIHNNSEVTAITMPGQSADIVYIDSKDFAPSYDYDFTNVKDTSTHSRGNYEYKRPCGWRRFAVKVEGKYGNDDSWLGDNILAWPVSYHGSQNKFAMTSVVSGEEGLCSCPHIDECLDYASRFEFNGVQYFALFQNRVNPARLKIVNNKFWILPADDDIRPYGIIIRKVHPDPPAPSSGCILS